MNQMNDGMMMVSADTLAEMFRKSHVVDEATMKIVLPIFQAAVELAADAVKAEREACAKIADEWGKRKDQMTDTAFVPGACHGERYAADGIYNAIRARGKT